MERKVGGLHERASHAQLAGSLTRVDEPYLAILSSVSTIIDDIVGEYATAISPTIVST